MSTPFREYDHPRSGSGRFAPKQHADADITLDDSSVVVETSSSGVPTVDELVELRQRAEAEAATTPARKAYEQAVAEGMQMSDDPRVSARFRDLESAAQRAFDATPAGMAYARASELRRHALRTRAVEPSAPAVSRSEEVRRVLAAAAERRRSARTAAPEDLAKQMSPAALRVALRGLRRDRPSRASAHRIAVIEAELHSRGESVA